jgi:hypothetical protein
VLVEARTARADELVDVGVVARGAQELPAIDHVHVRALANPDGSAVGPRIDAQRPHRGEKAQELLLAPGHAAAAGAAHLARATDAIVSEAEQAMAQPVPRGKTAKRIACLALRREEPERFAFDRSPIDDADARQRLGCETPGNRGRVLLYHPQRHSSRRHEEGRNGMTWRLVAARPRVAKA